MKTLEYNAQTGETTERDMTPEEVAQAEAIAAIQPSISYEQKVIELIRQKYSIDEELAIQRQKDTKPDEFQQYFDYCEQCKTEAKN